MVRKNPEKDIQKNWERSQKISEVTRQYNAFLKDESRTHNQESIELFTINKTRNGVDKLYGFTERELIKILGGTVPDYY